MERIFKQDVFQKTLSVIFGVASIPLLTSPYKEATDEAIRLMQRIWLQQGRCIRVSDLAMLPQGYLKQWTTTGEFIRACASKYEENIPSLGVLYESLKSEEHVVTVSILWSQLHLKRVEKDLRFLLQLVLHFMKDDEDVAKIVKEPGKGELISMVSGRLVFMALQGLTLVPWLELPSLVEKVVKVKCESCGDYFYQLAGAEVRECGECHKPVCLCCSYWCKECDMRLCKSDTGLHRDFRCPDCGQSYCETSESGYPAYCIVCEEEICAECYHFCQCCFEAVCDDCDHGEYVCETCNGDFCDNHPEEIEKVECPSCGSEFCEICAQESVFECPKCGKDICTKCCEECEDCETEFCESCFAEHDCSK